MDPHARLTVWELIGRLRADGVAVVLTTHLLDEAEELADTIVIIDHGRVVAEGTPAELTGSDAREQLRFAGPPELDLDALGAALPGCHAAETSPGHYLLTGTVTPDLLAALTAWCARRGVLLTEVRVDATSLQDVFLALTGREVRA